MSGFKAGDRAMYVGCYGINNSLTKGKVDDDIKPRPLRPLLTHFLLVYDNYEGKIVQLHEFTDPGEAVREYSVTEDKCRHGWGRFEVVLLGADSLATVKRTHGRYFNDQPKDALSSRVESIKKKTAGLPPGPL